MVGDYYLSLRNRVSLLCAFPQWLNHADSPAILMVQDQSRSSHKSTHNSGGDWKTTSSLGSLFILEELEPQGDSSAWYSAVLGLG